MARVSVIQGERLDLYVAKKLPNLSRSSAQKLIELGKVRVNGDTEDKPGFKLHQKDKVLIDYDEKAQAIPAIELEVIYEDEDCAVINKPVGVLSHSKGAFNPEATVASWLQSRAPVMTGDRAGIVHRLDRTTSGVMIVAKTPEALAWLQKKFSQRKVKKTYVAVAEGKFKDQEAVIDMPIERNPRKPQTFRVGSNGKPAQTPYKVSTSHNNLTLVNLEPLTGRTHQLRVHLSYIGHPIHGDTLYGGKSAERVFLHAKSLELTLPNGERKVFTAPVPSEFLDQLK